VRRHSAPCTRARRRWPAWALVLVVGLQLGVRAGAAEPDVARSVLILARAMAYDRALVNRPGPVRIGVVFDPLQPASQREAETILAVFAGMPEATISSRPLTAALVPVAELNAQIDGVTALYLCAGLETKLPELLATSRSQDTLTVTHHHAWVARGVSLGVRWTGDRGNLLVNLPASKAEGSALASELLVLAEVIR
jgi:YfiR/HmsC-like